MPAPRRALLAFLGPRVVALLAASIAIGVLLFAAELALAWGLQGFVASLGFTPAPASSAGAGALLGRWLSSLGVPGLIGLALGRAALAGAGAYAQGAATERFKHAQRARVVRWALGGAAASSARASVLFNEQVSQAAHAVAQVQSALLDLTLAACLLPGLVAIAPGLTAAVLPLVLLPALPLRLLKRRLARLSGLLAAEWDRVARRLTAGVRNLLLLRVHGTAAAERAQAEAGLDRCLDHTLAYHRAGAAELAYGQALALIIVCAVALAARTWAAVDPAALVAFFYLLYRLVQQLARIGYSATAIAFGAPHLRALMDFWAAEQPATESSAAPVDPAPPLTGPVGWRLDRVSFAYPGASAPVLRELSLEIPPGAAVVITGPSGAGKSTLLGLLAGELAPDAGAIVVLSGGEERPLAGVHDGLRAALGYAGAEGFMIEGTVRDNLLYGVERAPAPDDDAMERALALAGCGFVRDLPGGLEHRVDERGGGLSAGQRQRLGLARALLRTWGTPGALLLDEATSGLDLRAEEEVVRALGGLKGRVTIVAATHRAALLAIADRRVELPG